MASTQEIIILDAKARGFHLISNEIKKKSKTIHIVDIGIAHLFLMHTSASISLNENTDPSVRIDFETFSNAMIPENFAKFTHTYEGNDDMPAHIKSSLYGVSLSIPIQKGQFLLGTWQGIYLNEHRNHGGNRKLAITLLY